MLFVGKKEQRNRDNKRKYVTSADYVFPPVSSPRGWAESHLGTETSLFSSPFLSSFNSSASGWRTRWTCLWTTLSRWTKREKAAEEDRPGPGEVQDEPLEDRRGRCGADKTTSTARGTTDLLHTPGYERQEPRKSLILYSFVTVKCFGGSKDSTYFRLEENIRKEEVLWLKKETDQSLRNHYICRHDQGLCSHQTTFTLR